MKRQILVFVWFLFASTIALPTAVSAQALWQKSATGMSLNQVKKLFPEAKAPSSPSSVDSGARELLRIDQVKIVNKSFKASFFFLEGKLSEVMLQLDPEEDYSSSKFVFDNLTDALRAKYGKENSHSDKVGAVLKMNKSQWISAQTNIELQLLAVGDSPAALVLVYQGKVAKDAEKL